VGKGLFVTGTDTDAGKTVVTCALLSLLARRGRSVVGFKPVAAGADRTPGGLRNEDARWLRTFSSIPVEYEDINPFVLESAIAPHIAAQAAGTRLEAGAMLDCRRKLGDKAQVVVTEGAGGWMVPLSPGTDMADLAAAIDDPVILVVGMRLGCLNHALLTAQAIRSRGCLLAGWVANRLDPRMPAYRENLDTLAGRLGCRPLGSVPWLGNAPMERKIELASRGIDGDMLEAALATD
jgi:dethiobiotin synthetase